MLFMELSIIRRVAQYVNWKKLESSSGQDKNSDTKVKRDSVNISQIASDVKGVTDQISKMPERDTERETHIANLKDALEKGNYEMTDEMVDSIAEKIANSLL